jgi:hypothetical protein
VCYKTFLHCQCTDDMGTKNIDIIKFLILQTVFYIPSSLMGRNLVLLYVYDQFNEISSNSQYDTLSVC